VKCRFGELVILENRFKRTAFSAMIELHFGKPVCVEGDRTLSCSGFKELVFGHEKELGS